MRGYDPSYSFGLLVGEKAHTLYLFCSRIKNPGEVISFLVYDFPSIYKAWWLDLLENDPGHIIVETFLCGVILFNWIYQKIYFNKQMKKRKKTQLSSKEEDQLINDWLVSSAKEELGFPLTECQKWRIEQMDKIAISSVHKSEAKFVEITAATLNGKEPVKERSLINLASFDFLGMFYNNVPSEGKGGGGINPEIHNIICKSLDKYGCGACGPRQFYGTIDTSLHLEEACAKFMNAEKSVFYSDAASCLSSVVCTFAKRGDYLVCDEFISEPLLSGVILSRANIKFFKHNDPDDLERILNEIKKEDERAGRKSQDICRFILVEGIYRNCGDIAPLDEIVELKHKFNYRLVVDESHSFGVLGKTGRGAMEHFGKKLMHDAELITISLENAFGVTGALGVGSANVIDVQRMYGIGYIFSAATPPFMATVAQKFFSILETDYDGIIGRLSENTKFLHEKINKDIISGLHFGKDKSEGVLELTSDGISPIIFFKFSESFIQNHFSIADSNAEKAINAKILRGKITKLFDDIEYLCKQNGLAIVSTGGHITGEKLHKSPPPSLRLVASANLTKKDINEAVQILKKCITKTLKEHSVEVV